MALSQAPELKFNGEDKDYSGRGLAIRTHDLEEAIMNGLGGRDVAALKLMFFLTGCGEGFRIAEQTVLDNCNMTQPNYIKARQKLVEMGWITHSQGGFIAVNYYNIRTYRNDMPDNEETYRNETETYCNDMSNTYCNDMHNNLINNINNNNIILPSFAELQTQARAGLF